MTKWYIKIIRRSLSATVLNSMIICRENSQGKRNNHSQFRSNMVPPLFLHHGANVKREVSGRHTTYNTAPRLVVRLFPERIPPTESKSKPTKRCVMC
jgi:hypothetical protein